MKRFKEHLQNIIDAGKYGGLFEDILIGMFFGGVLFLLLWAVGKSLGVL